MTAPHRLHRRRPWLARLIGLLAFVCVACPVAAQEGSVYELSLVDLAGKRTVLGTLPGSVFAPRISPDGKRVAYESPDPRSAPGQERIWIAELARLKRARSLPPVGTGRNWAPLWSRDGERVLFLVSGSGPDAIWWRRIDGAGDAEFLVNGLSAEGLTPDGLGLTFITVSGDRDYGISLLDLMTRGSRVLIDRPRSEQHSSTVSPDGRWVAYASNESGRHEIWLDPLVGAGQRTAVTHGGGSHPVWSPDGRRLYFDQDSRLYAVDLRFENGVPRPDEPQALPIEGFQQGYRRRQFDLMPDGQHFLMLFPRGAR